jgi:uncharacterized membrane protein
VRQSRILLGALAGAQIAYPRAPRRHLARATQAVVALMLAAAATEAAEARGPGRTATLLASAAGIGLTAEHVGVRSGRPFGRYSYSAGLGRRVGGVPPLAGAAWALMARPAWVVAGLIDDRPARRVPLAAAALTAWDVFLDPRMVRDGFWSWEAGGRYEGVPATNFAGWFAVSLCLFAAWAKLDPDDDPRVDGDGALALYAWTWVGETFANVAIWRRPRVAAVGGAAMGSLAVPALLGAARVRRATHRSALVG